MHVTKRRLLLGAAGVLMSLSLAVPVAAGGTDHGRTDVNDVTGGTRGGLIEGSDGGDRNIQAFNGAAQLNVSGSSTNVQGAFLYENAVEFNASINASLRNINYDERFPEPPSAKLP